MDLFYKNQDMKTINSKIKSGNHPIYFFLFLYISMVFAVPVAAQEVPIPAYQLKYWCDPYEYPLGGIELEKPPKKLDKFLSQTYFNVVNAKTGTDVTFFPQWGYDSIRCIPKSFKISPFYIQKKEVTNAEYREFLADSNSAFFTEGKISSQWAHPDTNVWLQGDNAFMLPFVSYYFKHPAYSKYPVVGVSQYQATQYCNWLEEKLNAKFKDLLPKGYVILVDLPTQAEFVKAVNVSTRQSATHPIQNPALDYIKYWVQSNLGNINMGPIKTLRLADLYSKNPDFFHLLTTEGDIDLPSHLLGNVAEWTSTSAKGKLYNNLKYVYTMSERLIPNPDITATAEQLQSYLHEDTDLKSHYMLKGGSWLDEFHYVDPSAIMFKRGDYKAANVGFRTVIRIVPSS
jgi:formylglycine-generating enzyme required for sulfatase activity